MAHKSVPSTTPKVLVVGAGGIGCELLKNLVLSGFPTIDVVDLDTIDLSNLNRQFLFQTCHIGQSKATVAAQAVRRFNPRAQVRAYHDNIMDARFDAQWFGQFDLVLNALDNLAARRYVNQMCLATDRPLVEAGTAGYLGQVTVIAGHQTECFDCQPKPTPKTFPICTIRSTPSAPIHCIVWAKDYLFGQLFGPEAGGSGDGEEESIAPPTETDDREEIQNLRREANALKTLRAGINQPDTFVEKVFAKVFDQDIHRLLSMEDMWNTRRRPEPLDYTQFSHASTAGAPPRNGALATNGDSAISSAESLGDQTVWDLDTTVRMFEQSAHRLTDRFQEQAKCHGRGAAGITFDKDDVDVLDFVTAASNLRSVIFHIPPKSKFDVKAMAGNIIPAIATTNAIVAGIMTLQARHLLLTNPVPVSASGPETTSTATSVSSSILGAPLRLDRCQTTYLTQNGKNRPRLFYNEKLADPNPNCGTCRRRFAVAVVHNWHTVTLQDLVALVTERHADVARLGEDLLVMEGGRLLADPDFDDNLDRSLADLSLTTNRFVTIMNEDDGDTPDGVWPICLCLTGAHPDKADNEASDKPPVYLLNPTALRLPEVLPIKTKAPTAKMVEAEEDQIPAAPALGSTKRKAQDSLPGTPTKAVRGDSLRETVASYEIIMVDDDDEGQTRSSGNAAIVLDD
ncbi:E1 ubiquitin-activating protein uba2 [Tieghemiomyces parasiticus]|uniref:E1 ubiquitin-activating protein uba2 n=1 Tax=Tieghemiomyces parasiticus TaxID=78921 RepID=A0A9W8DZB5_9FUNG|nr:E1 ubiquitin-activating protein uba2 [Tieghemiomyces parasiticus]